MRRRAGCHLCTDEKGEHYEIGSDLEVLYVQDKEKGIRDRTLGDAMCDRGCGRFTMVQLLSVCLSVCLFVWCLLVFSIPAV